MAIILKSDDVVCSLNNMQADNTIVLIFYQTLVLVAVKYDRNANKTLVIIVK